MKALPILRQGFLGGIALWLEAKWGREQP